MYYFVFIDYRFKWRNISLYCSSTSFDMIKAVGEDTLKRAWIACSKYESNKRLQTLDHSLLYSCLSSLLWVLSLIMIHPPVCLPNTKIWLCHLIICLIIFLLNLLLIDFSFCFNYCYFQFQNILYSIITLGLCTGNTAHVDSQSFFP